MIQSCSSGENDIAEDMSLPGNWNYLISKRWIHNESTAFYDFYIKFLFLIFFITVITTDEIDKVDDIDKSIKLSPPITDAQAKVKSKNVTQRRNTICGPRTETVSSSCSLNPVQVPEPLSMPSNQFNTHFYS